MRIILVFSIIILSVFNISAQNNLKIDDSKSSKIVKISGVTVSSDSLNPLPFTNIFVKGDFHGTLSDYSGYFSMLVGAGDTIVFTNLGYKKAQYILPENLENSHYSIIQVLDRDTILLEETNIISWPTYKQFEFAFLNTKMPVDKAKVIADKNLKDEYLQEGAMSMDLSPRGNQKLMLEQRKTRLYYAGQTPTSNLINPIAWARFIQAWKDGTLPKE